MPGVYKPAKMAKTKIQALTSAAGMDYTIAAGEICELPDEIAADLIQAGFAIKVGTTEPAAEPKKPGRPKAEQ